MAMIPGEDDDDGVCILHETHKNYGQVPGFPDCFFATRVMNFFMGRTDGIRSVGFYPAYSRKADEAIAELWGAKPSVTTSQIRRFTAHYLEPWSELNSDPEP
ncbi:Beta-1,4 N-acetylgalactosaminyltransferase 1 [Branchiostoma belcheri]|nr:Beta-1,4 N-acetylgalactosaminyltransferase 1 [Branchiostoma belcheri]